MASGIVGERERRRSQSLEVLGLRAPAPALPARPLLGALAIVWSAHALLIDRNHSH